MKTGAIVPGFGTGIIGYIIVMIAIITGTMGTGTIILIPISTILRNLDTIHRGPSDGSPRIDLLWGLMPHTSLTWVFKNLRRS